MKNTKKEILMLAIIIILQTIIYICVGANKSYLHIDEAYSFGLTHYSKVDIQNNDDFFDNWHNKKYYEEYLSVQDDEIMTYKQVYENQKNDVHPPLYYVFLKFFMGFTKGHFSMWPGFALNIIIYAFITIFAYLILKKLFKDEKNADIKSAIIAFVSSIILASLSNVIYIRMYALSTLNVMITTFLHIKLLEKNKVDAKLFTLIGINVLAGILTHYYYIFYLAFMYIVFFIKYIKEKNIKILKYYTLTMIIAGVTSLIIFPYSINHMFFGYRGQGVITNFKSINRIIPNILEQIHNLNYYVFNNLMYLIIVIIIGMLIYIKKYKKENIKISEENKKVLHIIFIPTLLFFIITAVASPWNVLRYIVPVCGLIFILIIYYLYKILKSIYCEKTANTLMSILLCIILISPFIFKLQPELMYSDRKEIVQELSEEYNLPTIYLFNSKAGNYFLDDILLFTILKESYIAKDMEITESNIQDVLKNKDVSNGVIIFINGGQDDNNILDTIKKSLKLTNCKHLTKLISCNVYVIN